MSSSSTTQRLALLSSVSRAAVIRALRASSEPMAVADLASAVGLHANTIRWHLDQLVEASLVERIVESKGRRGRPRLLYALAAQAADDAFGAGGRHDQGYRLLADILAGYLAATSANPVTSATEAGRAWGGYLVERPAPFAEVDAADARRRVVRLLDDLGFEPAPSGGGAISLRACPFRDVANAHPDIVCSVHLGLMQGALVELGMPAMAAHLKPFDSADTCLAHITAAPTEFRANNTGRAPSHE